MFQGRVQAPPLHFGFKGKYFLLGNYPMNLFMSAASPFALVIVIFLVSLLIVLGAAAWFTRRLEALCDKLDLSAGMLSILSALGANIPNYVASIVAIANGEQDVGLGIIIGSNIYNLAIILGISSLVAPGSHGIRLQIQEKQDVVIIAYYALAITVATILVILLLPATSFVHSIHTPLLILLALIFAIVLALVIFGSLVLHIVRRPHPAHAEVIVKQEVTLKTVPPSLKRLIAEVVLALLIALGGVIVMVQSGQQLTADLHMPSVLAGLLVLAVATSLPNTVVAVILVRTGRVAACVEEIFSSNSINAALGIALPLLIWRTLLQDRLLLWLDAPFILLLTLSMIVGIRIGRVNRIVGLLLILSYAAWVGVHLLVNARL
jgi:cation:H+ antiporter